MTRELPRFRTVYFMLSAGEGRHLRDHLPQNPRVTTTSLPVNVTYSLQYRASSDSGSS